MLQKSWILYTITLMLCLAIFSTSAQARDSLYMLPFKDILALPKAGSALDSNIRMYFGDQVHPKVISQLGGYFSNRQGNAVFKSDVNACRDVALSVLQDLQARARAIGANAIINISSFYEQKPRSDDNFYECHSGSMLAAVSLKADMVTIEP